MWRGQIITYISFSKNLWRTSSNLWGLKRFPIIVLMCASCRRAGNDGKVSRVHDLVQTTEDASHYCRFQLSSSYKAKQKDADVSNISSKNVGPRLFAVICSNLNSFTAELFLRRLLVSCGDGRFDSDLACCCMSCPFTLNSLLSNKGATSTNVQITNTCLSNNYKWESVTNKKGETCCTKKSERRHFRCTQRQQEKSWSWSRV